MHNPSELSTELFAYIGSSADFFQNQLFLKILSEIPSECQTAWIQISTSGSKLLEKVIGR